MYLGNINSYGPLVTFLAKITCQRFFTNHMLSSSHSFNYHLCMRIWRCADIYNIHLWIVKDIMIVQGRVHKSIAFFHHVHLLVTMRSNPFKAKRNSCITSQCIHMQLCCSSGTYHTQTYFTLFIHTHSLPSAFYLYSTCIRSSIIPIF